MLQAAIRHWTHRVPRLGWRSLWSHQKGIFHSPLSNYLATSFDETNAEIRTIPLLAMAAFAAILGGSTIAQMEEAPQSINPETQEVLNQPPQRPDLPIYTMEEVAEHCDEDSLWYTFRGGVYDLTFFINGHPGGSPRLLMAAGQDFEPYWHVYRQHFRGHVTKWMEQYRIGNLSPEEAKIASSAKVGDMFDNEPQRHPDLLPATLKPFNGEPRIERLTDDYFTPNEIFYTRCHLAVPDIDAKEYQLIVSGKGIKKKRFTLEQLKAMPKHEVATTVESNHLRFAFHSLTKSCAASMCWKST